MDTSQLNLEKFESVLKVATKRNNEVFDNVQRALDTLFKEKALRGLDRGEGEDLLYYDQEADSFQAFDNAEDVSFLVRAQRQSLLTNYDEQENEPTAYNTTSPSNSSQSSSAAVQQEEEQHHKQQQQQPSQELRLALPFGYRPPIVQSAQSEEIFASYHEFWKNREDYSQGHVVDNAMHYGYNEKYHGFKLIELTRDEFEAEVDLYTATDGEYSSAAAAITTQEAPKASDLDEEDDDCFTFPVIASKTGRGKPSFEEDSVVAKRYVIVTLAGAGSFSKTYVAKDLLLQQRLCCIKAINADFEVAVNEVSILRRLGQDPGNCIVTLLDCFYLPLSPCLVFELLYDNLYEVAEKFRLDGAFFTEPVLAHVARQVLCALEHAHGQGIIHADLKPENIMLTEPVSREQLPDVKVIDWGCAKRATRLEEISLDAEDSYFQTRAYRAPEVILGCGFGPSIDTWSLGVILGELFTNRLFLNSTTSVPHLLASICSVCGPFPLWMVQDGVFAPRYFTNGFLVEHHLPQHQQQQGEEEEIAVAMVNVLFPKPSNVADRLDSDDAHFADFLTRLLQVDPNQRLDVRAAQQHEFIQQQQ